MNARAVGSVRLNGIRDAAAALPNGNGGTGVSIQHLRKVVLGIRASDVLLEAVRRQFPGLLAPGGKTWREAGYGYLTEER